MTPTDKAPMQWWIEQFNGRKVPTFSAYVEKPRFSPIILKIDDEKTIPAYEYFHVIEYSAVTALQADIAKLKEFCERVADKNIKLDAALNAIDWHIRTMQNERLISMKEMGRALKVISDIYFADAKAEEGVK